MITEEKTRCSYTAAVQAKHVVNENYAAYISVVNVRILFPPPFPCSEHFPSSGSRLTEACKASMRGVDLICTQAGGCGGHTGGATTTLPRSPYPEECQDRFSGLSAVRLRDRNGYDLLWKESCEWTVT